MRRWNGWGDETDDSPLAPAAHDLLAGYVGRGTPSRDATLEQALSQIPKSRIHSDGHPFETDARARLLHAYGQSLPDWIALRSGRIGPVADGVCFPKTHDEAVQALNAAQRLGAVVIPYGGGTSVVGHLKVPLTDRPVVNISLEHMNRLLDLDETAQLATFGAGAVGSDVEAQLLPSGHLLGHYPQSYLYSTLGGWVVTRSSGQQSMRYGRIENMFAGGRLVTPRGELRVGGVPASAAGPDLREAVLGSEGRLGLLTEVTARIRRLPACEDFHAVFFPDWNGAVNAARQMVQADLPLSMVRLSNEVETETQLQLSGHPDLVRWLARYLGLRGITQGKCMLVMGVTGSEAATRRLRRDALALCKRYHGVHVGRTIGKGWKQNRFRGPLLRNALWEAGYVADTVETAVNWPSVTPLMRAIENAAVSALARDEERVHAFTHLSHLYRQGCSIYSTFVYRASGDPQVDLERWSRLKSAVSRTIVAHGGTISHQHGVGVDHAPYLPQEKGPLGMDLVRAVARELDPEGIMNPGKLFS